jgi:hypothetical protein
MFRVDFEAPLMALNPVKMAPGWLQMALLFMFPGLAVVRIPAPEHAMQIDALS